MSVPTLKTGGALAELEYGRYTNVMPFTGITVCTTLTCVMSGGNRLLGGHFSMGEAALDYTAVLNGMANLMAGDHVIEMYIVRVAGVWIPQGGFAQDARFYAVNQPTTFRTAFGYTGAVHVREVEGDDGHGGGDRVTVQYLPTNVTQVSVNGAPVPARGFTVDPALPLPPIGGPVGVPAPTVGQRIARQLRRMLCMGD